MLLALADLLDLLAAVAFVASEEAETDERAADGHATPPAAAGANDEAAGVGDAAAGEVDFSL